MSLVEPIRKVSDIKAVECILKKKNYRDLLLFILGINSGLRISDILKLDVSDVKNKDYISIIEKKTGKFKKFPINNKLKKMIKVYVENKDIDEPLFMTKFKNRLDRNMAYRIINNVCKIAGIESNIGTHTLRKTFGYHHYKQFKDVALLQKILNHSNPQVTMRYIGIEQDSIDESYKNFVL